MLRTMCHANRFEQYTDLRDFNRVLEALPPYQRPGILPEQLSGVPAKLPRLEKSRTAGVQVDV